MNNTPTVGVLRPRRLERDKLKLIIQYNTIKIKIYIAQNSLIKGDRGAGWSARW